jgi:hypothetical protein
MSINKMKRTIKVQMTMTTMMTAKANPRKERTKNNHKSLLPLIVRSMRGS